jgi:hypothetical protein
VPFLPVGPDTVSQGVAARFRFAGQSEQPERVRYICAWGDGLQDSSAPVRSGQPVELEHAWSDTGAFEVRSRALDEAGRLSDWSEPALVAVVNRAPPAPGLAGPDTTFTDTVTEFAATTIDPESDLLDYDFDWGDGETYTASGYASGAVCRAVHIWRGPGEYAVRVRARDRANHASGWSPARMLQVVGRQR